MNADAVSLQSQSSRRPEDQDDVHSRLHWTINRCTSRSIRQSPVAQVGCQAITVTQDGGWTHCRPEACSCRRSSLFIVIHDEFSHQLTSTNGVERHSRTRRCYWDSRQHQRRTAVSNLSQHPEIRCTCRHHHRGYGIESVASIQFRGRCGAPMTTRCGNDGRLDAQLL